MTDGIPEITPTELKARQDRGDDLFILDVREPHEYQICNLNGKLIPARRTSAARQRTRQLAGDGCPLPQRKALGRRHSLPAKGRIQEALEPQGRRTGLVG